ncbi:MAG: hypothetical protein KAQ83_02390 [Nanoarchaeota archaeon]|nr:hypothetical protein [Nanoarchaeota archaeon]
MQEKTLLQTALIVAVLGVTILFLISGRIDFNKESLLNAEGGDSVILTGKITEIAKGNKFTKITITYQETVDIIVFENINLTENNIIEVVGTKNKNKEIIAEKIKISYLHN